jgi:DNA-binding transcriptional LysR family regulator
MTTRDPGWELYRSFLAVLREGSLSAAARSLGLTQPTIGRHIRQLENALGTPLFTRSPHGLAPTAAAATLEPHAAAMAGAAAALLRAAPGQTSQTQGVVRIAASEIIGAEVLPPILADFRRAHPGVVIELSLSDRMEDLLRRDADIAVRMARPTQGALVARHIGRVPLGLFAHRRYVEARGRPAGMGELAQHAMIGFDRETASIRALRRLGLRMRREDFAFRADSHLAQLAAIRSGVGIGICQVPLARLDPELVHVLPHEFAMALDMWLAMHQDLRASGAVRATFNHLGPALAVDARGSARSGGMAGECGARALRSGPL